MGSHRQTWGRYLHLQWHLHQQCYGQWIAHLLQRPGPSRPVLQRPAQRPRDFPAFPPRSGPVTLSPKELRWVRAFRQGRRGERGSLLVQGLTALAHVGLSHPLPPRAEGEGSGWSQRSTAGAGAA